MSRRIELEHTEQIAALLERGGVVALPTDTVYGVGARLDQPAAVARLFRLKDRPTNVALPVLIGERDQLAQLDCQLNERATRLIDAFWPGPLTVVLPADETLARRVGSSQGTLGVRLPDDPALRRLLRLSGPMALTSANRHAQAPCSSADDVERAFLGSNDLDAIIDGGHRSGMVSTVVDVSGIDLVVLREGAISAESLAAVTKNI
jgi:tRNA threonylcarbamoyl adenosine modification protein (Sua5/YciO/YrdC/YwlC family)